MGPGLASSATAFQHTAERLALQNGQRFYCVPHKHSSVNDTDSDDVSVLHVILSQTVQTEPAFVDACATLDKHIELVRSGLKAHLNSAAPYLKVQHITTQNNSSKQLAAWP